MLFFAIIFMTAQSAMGDNDTATFFCPKCTVMAIYADFGSKEIARFSCPNEAPYCNATSGSCSALPSLDCASTDTFICTQNGVFPHPTDCQKFRVCENNTSYIYSCPPFSNFDYSQGTCVRGAPCYTMSCNGKTGSKVAYHYARVYAFCVNDVPLFIEKCPGSYEMDANTQTCRPTCQAVGNKIPDVNDCTKYYYCSKEPYASDYTVTSEQCPQGQGFHPSFLRCEPLKILPACDSKMSF